MLKLIKLAAEVADLSADRSRKAFLGAVAIRKDGVIVHARNSATHPPNFSKNPNSHAEFKVLHKAGDDSSVYVARVTRDGNLALAKPCPRCLAVMRSHRVEMVYYSISNDEWEAIVP